MFAWLSVQGIVRFEAVYWDVVCAVRGGALWHSSYICFKNRQFSGTEAVRVKIG